MNPSKLSERVALGLDETVRVGVGITLSRLDPQTVDDDDDDAGRGGETREEEEVRVCETKREEGAIIPAYSVRLSDGSVDGEM